MSKVKEFFSNAWDLLVFIAYLKFYIMCLCGFLITLVLAAFVISEAGGDVGELAPAIKWAGYIGVFYVAIIMIDKMNRGCKDES
jgi:hypothetical protein